jgi:acyl carrier protein
VNDAAIVPDPLVSQLKHFIVDSLGLRDLKANEITDYEPLMGGRIGLDPLDAAELAMHLEETLGIAIRGQKQSDAAFANVASLAAFVRQHAPASPFAPQVVLPLEFAVNW